MNVGVDDWDLPILGEPIPVELANTRYRDDDEVMDFLSTPAMVARWFSESPTAAVLARPRRWTNTASARLVELRNIVDDLLRARIDRSHPEAATVAKLNEIAGLVTSSSQLQWHAADAVRRVDRLTAPDPTDVILGTIATETITLLAGHESALLRVCANDDCQMLFLKHHHRRRWCHNSCGHRHRQATYYRSRGRGHT